MIKRRIYLTTRSSLYVICFTGCFLALLSCSRQPVYPDPVIADRDAVIEISDLLPETPQFYTYRHAGKKINFFVIKIEQNISSFLDACASCYAHKRGYRYEDGTVTCRDCNMKFSIYHLEKGLGGCYPIKIDGRSANGRYFIPLTYLQTASAKF